jgi:hypothetical protein
MLPLTFVLSPKPTQTNRNWEAWVEFPRSVSESAGLATNTLFESSCRSTTISPG